MKLADSLAESTGASSLPAQQSFNLLTDRLLRIAEFTGSERSIILESWERTSVDTGFFTPPSDYSVENLGTSTPSKESNTRSGN
jgi:hypothetical protein